METSLEKYKKDLAALIERGRLLFYALQFECNPDDFKKWAANISGDPVKSETFLKNLPNFRDSYQSWYSEAQSVIKQILPNRFNDFVGYYEKPRNRKEIDFESYVIADCLQGLFIKRGGEIKVDSSASIPQFQQQLNILKSVSSRFESSLFDIRQIVQADLFDSELDAARELLKNKFGRAAGAMAGVVLERHLQQVCGNHSISITKKYPAIGDLNDALKNGNVVETVTWRFIQHLGDLRNLCDHNKTKEPTNDNITDLIDGVDKITKTLF